MNDSGIVRGMAKPCAVRSKRNIAISNSRRLRRKSLSVSARRKICPASESGRLVMPDNCGPGEKRGRGGEKEERIDSSRRV